MSKSVKSAQSKRLATNSSASAERKPALSIIKDIQPDADAGQTRRQYSTEEKNWHRLPGVLSWKACKVNSWLPTNFQVLSQGQRIRFETIVSANAPLTRRLFLESVTHIDSLFIATSYILMAT